MNLNVKSFAERLSHENLVVVVWAVFLFLLSGNPKDFVDYAVLGLFVEQAANLFGKLKKGMEHHY